MLPAGERVAKRFTQVRRVLDRPTPLARERIERLAGLLVVEPRERLNGGVREVAAAKEPLDEGSEHELDMGAMAERLFVSPSHLRELFRCRSPARHQRSGDGTGGPAPRLRRPLLLQPPLGYRHRQAPERSTRWGAASSIFWARPGMRSHQPIGTVRENDAAGWPPSAHGSADMGIRPWPDSPAGQRE
jgi:hypothetical protein